MAHSYVGQCFDRPVEITFFIEPPIFASKPCEQHSVHRPVTLEATIDGPYGFGGAGGWNSAHLAWVDLGGGYVGVSDDAGFGVGGAAETAERGLGVCHLRLRNRKDAPAESPLD